MAGNSDERMSASETSLNHLRLTFNGKRVLVTGASRGIGEAIAKTLIDLDAHVAVTSTGKPPLWINGALTCRHFELDFKRPSTVEKFLSEIDQFGRLDALVNNAGIQEPQCISDITEGSWGSVFDVNLNGPMRLIHHFSRKMQEGGGGKIVNVASIAASVHRRGSSAYSSSKAALIALTRSVAIDLAQHGVLVNAVSPGTTDTEMVDRILTVEQRKSFVSRIPLGRFATPQEVANAVVFLVSDLNTYITGHNLIVDGGTVIA